MGTKPGSFAVQNPMLIQFRKGNGPCLQKLIIIEETLCQNVIIA